jgi:hypothetical protein
LSAVLVAFGLALLWRVLVARHGRAVALATLLALGFGTVAYGIARGPSLSGAVVFAAVAAAVRLTWAGVFRAAPSPRRVWVFAAVVALAVLVAGDGGIEGFLDGLFSSGRGLLFWSPVLWLAVVGCLRDGPGPFAPLGPMLLILVLLGAGPDDLVPYRGARFAFVLPILALGLGRALDGLRGLSLRHPLVPVAGGIAALVAWNGLLMAQYRDGRIPRDDTVAFPRVARNAVATVSDTVGSPTAWPANWIFAARHGVSPARYDVLGGVDLFGTLGGVIDIGDLRSDAALLERGWSVRHPCGSGVCRAVEDTADLVAPIREPRDVDVRLVASGTGTLTMTVNGVVVLETPLADGEYFVRLPRARLRRGLNPIVLSVGPGGRALVDRIVFTPVPGGA